MEEDESKKILLDKLMQLQRGATKLHEWRKLEAIWLREKMGMSGEEVAEALGYRVQTVHLIWHRWKQGGIASLKDTPHPGGRKHTYLTLEEEKEFLAPFFEKADKGEITTVQTIREAYEQRVGKKVAPSTIYRLLARHGWRKISPRKKHPKSDPSHQEHIKKT